MLLRHTLLFLPAQLLPALCQFAALIAWSHLATAEVIGIVTLFTSIQEFLNIAFLVFWNQYNARYSMKYAESPEELERFQRASTVMVMLSLTIQIIAAIIAYAIIIDPHLSIAMGLVLAGLVGARALNLFQAERARARQDVLGYSIPVMSGPVFGFALGLGLLWHFGSSAYLVFLGFAVAQLIGVAFSLTRDRDWIRLGRPDMGIIRHAMGYGGPLIISTILSWVTQNASRLAISYVFGLAAVGIYSLGFGLGYRASMVSAMMVNAAAFPIAVRMANKGDLQGARRQLAANGTLLFTVLGASIVGLALVSSDVLTLLVSKSMHGPVRPVMLWSLLAGTFICIRQYFLNQFFLLESNTRPIATISIIEAVVAVALASAVVPFAGPVGGAMALAATSGTSVAVTYWWVRGAGLIVPWAALGRIALASAAMALAVLLIPVAHTVPQLILRIAVGGVVYVLVLGGLQWRVVIDKLKARRRSAAT